MHVGFLPLAARALVLIGGQVNHGLGVAVVRAAHDRHVACARGRAVRDSQRQVVGFRARVDKIGNLRQAILDT